MSADKPFFPTAARDALTEEGDYLLPTCLPKPGLLLGQELAVVVLSTLEGQRVGVPLGMRHALEHG